MDCYNDNGGVKKIASLTESFLMQVHIKAIISIKRASGALERMFISVRHNDVVVEIIHQLGPIPTLRLLTGIDFLPRIILSSTAFDDI